MTDYRQHFSTRATPQSQPIPGSTQVPNSAGGYSFGVDDWTRLDRFLILGAEGGSYYASESKLTIDNAQAVLRCIKADGMRVVTRVVEVSQAGRAAKNDPALFVLAMAFAWGDDEARAAAAAGLNDVARIGTHLFTFATYVEGFRGWGHGLRRAVGRWYTDKDPDALAYQLVKYRQRDGWTHRDLLRLAHPRSESPALAWAAKGAAAGEGKGPLPAIINDYERLQAAHTAADVHDIIAANPNVTWEMIPTEYLGNPGVWEALLPNMPVGAMVRNLGRMTANGLLAPMSAASHLVTQKLASTEVLHKARLHPISVLSALTTYQSGQGVRGNLSWTPVTAVVDALDSAFYACFANVEPAGKRTMLALDVSGSMTWSTIAGVPGLTPRVASAAMAMVTHRTEPQTVVTAFATSMVPVDISSQRRLDDVIRATERMPFGGTDCSAPMRWAKANQVEVDTFVTYTDSETWFGSIHPVQALRDYRQATGIPAKLVVVGMVSSGFTIADPDDGGMLDVVGFDTAAPALISAFSAGSI